MIEHLVISGGGHNVITMCGAISLLKKKNYLDFSTLKSVDATSAGTILAFAFLLGIDEDEMENYLINRPWEKVFNISPDVVFEAFRKKGLFDINVMKEIMNPIVKSCGVSIDITLRELYHRTDTDFYIYATELNNLEMITFSHTTHPDMPVINAVYLSCAVPPLFKPLTENNKCFLDGGVFANYPIDCFLERMRVYSEMDVDLSKVFGIKLIYESSEKDIISEESNISEYVFCLIKKLIQNMVIHREDHYNIPNELIIYSKGISFETLNEAIHSIEARDNLVKEGKKYANVYHIYKSKQDDESEPVNHLQPATASV
jgi:predicted acylesterase/phospholipase RssA